MHTHRRLLLTIGCALALGAGALLWWVLHAPQVTAAAYEQIELGLSLAEVEAIIGGPPGTYRGVEPHEYLPRSVLFQAPSITVVVPADNRAGVLNVQNIGNLHLAEPVTAGFMPNQSSGVALRHIGSLEEVPAVPPPVRRVLWTGPEYAIAVQLDAEDRVVNACLAKNFREPGMFEQLLRRIGIR
jgi:hypothetical protein